MKKYARVIIVVAVFVKAIDVLGMSIRVPSIGAAVVGAETIVIGTFIVKGEQVLVKAEDCLVGRVPESREVGVCVPRRQLFFSLPKHVQSLNGERCIVLAKRAGDVVELPYGAYSIWPSGVSSREEMGDFRKCLDVVRMLLKYKGVSGSNRTHLVSLLVDDLDTEAGRVAVTSYLAEDVVVWRDNNSLRKDIGCVVGWALLHRGRYDEAGRQYFFSGMPSVPVAIALRYFYGDYLAAKGKSRDLAENCLRSYLRSHGSGDCADITRAFIEDCAEQWLVSDMLRAIKLLDSDDSSICTFAPLVLSSISGIPQPAKMDEGDVKNFWANELEKMKANQKERALLVHTALYDSNYIVRKKALLRLKEITLCQKEQQDILFDTARKAIFDNNGIVRTTACGILRYKASDTNAFTIVEALCREFKIDRDARGAKTDIRLSKRKTWWRDSVVRSCIESLVFIGNLNPGAVELSYRKCPKGDVEYALLSVLAQLGRTADIEKMCRGISETSSEFVKLCLIRSLGETGDERAIPVLKDCVFDSFQIQTKDLKIVYPIREAAHKSLDAIQCRLNGQ